MSYQEAAKTAALVAISDSQRASAPEIPIAAVIHYGSDLQRSVHGAGEADYL